MALKCHTTVNSGSGTGVTTTRSWFRKNHVTHNVTATGLKYAHRKVQVFDTNTSMCMTDGTRSIKITKKRMRIFVGIFYVGGRPRRRWADNIRTDLQEVGCVYMDWIGLVQDRDRWWTLVSAVMKLRVP